MQQSNDPSPPCIHWVAVGHKVMSKHARPRGCMYICACGGRQTPSCHVAGNASRS